jgi:hypothetical protein
MPLYTSMVHVETTYMVQIEANSASEANDIAETMSLADMEYIDETSYAITPDIEFDKE